MPDEKPGVVARTLDLIERVGNKVPHPAIMFLALCIGVIVLSQVLAWVGVERDLRGGQAAGPGGRGDRHRRVDRCPAEICRPSRPTPRTTRSSTETAEVEGLLTADGIRFLFTSFVPQLHGLHRDGDHPHRDDRRRRLGASGLIASLIRKLVAVSSPATLTYIIVVLGVVSSIASDAGYLVLIPLGAAAFNSVGRHPLAGMAAAFAGVAGGFGVNLLITPTDAVLTEITNESIALGRPGRSIDITANL